MAEAITEIDRQIKERFESLWAINAQWMTKDQFAWFINYKSNRENIGDVKVDAEFLLWSIPDIYGKKILDVGCGPGDLVINLARRNIDAVGIDMSEEDIEISALKLNKYGLDEGICQVQDGARIPYPDESFDVVTCIEVLEHTEKAYMDVLGEMFRVLKPGGLLYMTIPNKHCPYDTHLYAWIPHWLPAWLRVPYLNKIRGEKAEKENYLLDYNFFSSREIKNILKVFSDDIDVNERYFLYIMKNMDRDGSRGIKSIIKSGIRKSSEIRLLNSLLIKLITSLYIFQSIKILARKK